MRTIERNYRNNPHTARWLMAFHDAHGANNTGGGAIAEADDLLDLVTETVDVRTPAQRDLMLKLTKQIMDLDPELGAKTDAYIARKSEAGAWESPARGGDVSAWISKMIAKVKELEAAQVPAPRPTSGTAVTIPAGRYAITDDEVKCYSINYGGEHGRWAGFTFLARISSDEEFPIRNAAEKARILDAIRADVDGARVLAAHTLRRCSRCHRQLSDTKNPYFAQGLGPDCGSK
jgi:hypothetical protein